MERNGNGGDKEAAKKEKEWAKSMPRMAYRSFFYLRGGR